MLFQNVQEFLILLQILKIESSITGLLNLCMVNSIYGFTVDQDRFISWTSEFSTVS